MSCQEVILCVDGGASKARAMLFHESQPLLGYLTAGLNPRLLSAREFERRLEHLLLPLLKGVQGEAKIIRATFALAGACSKRVQVYSESLAKDVLTRSGAKVEVRVMGDFDVFVETLLKEQDGIVIVAGTGSVCVGVKHRGGDVEKVKIGGWGALLDPGCGFRVGSEALRQALWEIDTGRPSKLTSMILEHYGCKSHDLREAVSGCDVRRIAEIAIVVARAYVSGSNAARKIWRRTAREIADLICSAQSMIKLSGEFPVYASGGLFRNGPLVRLVKRALNRSLPGSKFAVVEKPILELLYQLTSEPTGE